MLKPFQIAAFGRIPPRELGERTAVIVLVHADEESARANAWLLLDRLQETKLDDGTPLYVDVLRQVELDAVGQILVARLTYGGPPDVDYLSSAMLVDVPLTVHE